MKRNFIAKRFQSAGTGLTLDTAALAKYKDIVDLSIGDTDFTTDEAIINAAFRDAKAGHTHYGDPKGDPELISAVCKAWEEDFDQSLPRDHVLVSASSCLGMSLAMFAILDPGDEVIVFSPYFALYRAQIELAGGVCVDVPAWATICPQWRCLPAWQRNMIFLSRRTKFTRPTSTRATSAPSVHCPAWLSAPSRSTAFRRTF